MSYADYMYCVFSSLNFNLMCLDVRFQDHLRHLIETQVRKCPQSLFIFDEVDKMPAGLIDTIKPYLDYHEHLGGVDYRRAIFIFLR